MTDIITILAFLAVVLLVATVVWLFMALMEWTAALVELIEGRD